MPELVAGGPAVPVHLLNELDSGRVVFFCGAGISAGPGSDLPSFEDLVCYVYKTNHVEPDAVEREALDLEEQNPDRRRPNFDKALGLLERPERLRTQALRRSVIERLSEPPTGPLPVHKALIDLSRNGQGVRLITTNFDNRFVQAGLQEQFVDTAPKLPVPKPYAWSSVVHLHGRIRPDDDGSNLVLTAADFGRAYLTERWAARFITELFREFTVVFVGYSIGDPVMSYMVDALAAETAKGARFAKAYAFASYDGSDPGRQRTQTGWLGKNVRPILYHGQDGHALLADTLKEWARIRRDPFNARSQIAINEITKMPTGPEDPIVERVTWALEDPVAAKALADEPPIVDESDFAKVGSWVEVFAETGLLGCAAADDTPGSAGGRPGVVRLVDNGIQSESPQTLDMTRTHLARWLARHLHVPQLFAWVVRSGGHLHPGLWQQVKKSLADEGLDIPARLRLLWTVLLEGKATHPCKHLWTSDHYLAAASESERRYIEHIAIESISPRLIVRPGPAKAPALRRYFEDKPTSTSPMDACGHIMLISGEDDTRHHVEAILKDGEVLARHAETLTGHLERALALGVEDDDVYPDSSLYRPSISAHNQNRHHDPWTHLIDLVRDSYLALVLASQRRAENLLGRWSESDQALFKRLAFHALTENPKTDIQLARRLLVGGRKPGVWETEFRREVLRFFRRAGSRLPRRLRTEIVRAIHAGPKTRPRRPSPDYDAVIRREKSLRLHKLRSSGVRLDKRSNALAQEVRQAAEGELEERDEFLSWHDVGWVSDEESAPRDLVSGSVVDVVAKLEEEKVDRDGFRGLIVKRLIKSVSALRRLAKAEKWPPIYWQGLLWFLSEPREEWKRTARLRDYVARILVDAPGRLFGEAGSSAGGFMRRLAEDYSVDREGELSVIWMKAWNNMEAIGPQVFSLEDPLMYALDHPAGKLAEAALVRLRKYELRHGGGLPPPVRPYFEAIGTDPNGHLGRVMLATRLYHLFAVDADWTAEHLIARLGPGQSNEAFGLWSAYGWSPTIGPDLLRVLKEPFLDFLRDRRGDDRRIDNLWKLFMTVCLEAPRELTKEEIRGVAHTMCEEALKIALGSLKHRLRGELVERATVWREKVHPWLLDYWPREAARNTGGTSKAILDMLAECGEAFPDAAEWSLEFLRPLDRHGLYRLGESVHAEQHPYCMLRVLDSVVIADVLPIHQRRSLDKLLNRLVAVCAEVGADARFQKLFQIATR